MDDLISRQAAIEALGEKPLAWTESEYEQGLQNQWEQDVDALMALPAAQRWISVTERMPEEKKAVLVWEPRYLNHYTALLADGEWFVFGGFGTKVFEVTHWMPLPEPPKEEP